VWCLNELPAAVWCLNKLTLDVAASCTSHTVVHAVWLVQLAVSEISLFVNQTAAGMCSLARTASAAGRTRADPGSMLPASVPHTYSHMTPLRAAARRSALRA